MFPCFLRMVSHVPLFPSGGNQDFFVPCSLELVSFSFPIWVFVIVPLFLRDWWACSLVPPKPLRGPQLYTCKLKVSVF